MTLSINYNDDKIESFYLSGQECKEFLKVLIAIRNFVEEWIPNEIVEKSKIEENITYNKLCE